MKWWEAPPGLLETANLNHVSSNRSKTEGASHPFTRRWKKIQFLEQLMMDNAKNFVILSIRKEFRDKLFFTLHHTKIVSLYLKT
jgi:hypothetical protein